jgi:MFS family permease
MNKYDSETCKSKNKFLSLLMLVNGVAPVIAPALGGIILSVAVWRVIFVISLKMIPPSAGAITGATPLTSINKDRNLVNSLPLYRLLRLRLEVSF